MSERREEMSEQTSEWPCTYVLILGYSEPLWADLHEGRPGRSPDEDDDDEAEEEEEERRCQATNPARKGNDRPDCDPEKAVWE